MARLVAGIIADTTGDVLPACRNRGGVRIVERGTAKHRVAGDIDCNTYRPQHLPNRD